jgi:glycosyltransferase involved in cell wall biosynthesis
MNVLVLNRRDINHPSGGGAELYTHEIAKALIERGHEATIFSSRFKRGQAEESIDGVTYLRRGNELTVHLYGFFYALKNREKFDFIIDEFNGLGFFTFPLSKSVLLIHQLYKEFWLRELGAYGVIPYFIEPLYLRLYNRRPAITISESTKGQLERLGFRKENISILLIAIKNTPLDSVPLKESVPTLIYLGRLRSTKRPEDAIKIYRRVKEKLPSARLWMVGKGPEAEKLKRLAGRDPDITFWGWQGDDEKFGLLARAHVLLAPSVREGFGINVIEAASRGTPCVGYDVAGLKDSIRDNVTGFLVSNAEEASGKVIKLLEDKALYAQMAQNCLEYARGFNWQERGEEFARLIEKISGEAAS